MDARMGWLYKDGCTMLLVYLVAVYEVIRQFFIPHRCARGLENQNGRIAIVTGGAAGIGFETTKKLCLNGMRVFIASRCEKEATHAINRIRQEHHNALVEWIHLDLASLQSVRRCATLYKSYNLPLHVLVNNAGVMIPPFSETEDGFELQFQVNYLGHFLLSLLLLDLLVDSGELSKFSRIVNISSVVHVCGDLHADNLINRQVYCAYSSYAVSKLAIILSTYKLHQKLVARGSHVTVNCVHPGVVNTLLYQHSHWALQPFRKFLAMLRLLKTPTQGSDTPVYVALSAEIEGVGGLYFDNCVAKGSSTKSHDECLQCTLWDRSLELASVSRKECVVIY